MMRKNDKSATKLVSEVIAPNLPYYLQDAVDLSYTLCNTMAHIRCILTVTANKNQYQSPRGTISKNINGNNNGSINGNRGNRRNSNSNNNGNYNNNGRKFKNKCGIYGGHEWSECR